MNRSLKKMLFLFVLALASSMQSAFAFQAQATAYVSPGWVTVTACNTAYGSVISCNVTATGWLNAGFPIYSTVNLVLAPGQCDNAYVYANYPYFFVNGNGSAWCDFM